MSHYRLWIGMLLTCGLLGGVNLYADTALVQVLPLGQSGVSGTVSMAVQSDGLRVFGTIKNLAPGAHGFHIHEYGDCTVPDGISAGGHFNPGKIRHGDPMMAAHHMGDLGNIIANADGVAIFDRVIPGITADGFWLILGRSVIIHQSADDFMTQPSGASGLRVGCGIIGVVK